MRLINCVYDTIKSPSHNQNEDKILVIKQNWYSLFVLFDGVGSAKHALDAVNISSRFISDNYKKYEREEKFELSKLMYDTHLAIINSKIPEALSTYVALFIPNQDHQQASMSSMGDSRLYAVSTQYITQQTKDDNLSNRENVITKSLGMPKLENTDFSQVDFTPTESRYLLSSDGFYKLMGENIQDFYKVLNFSRFGNIKKALQKNIVNKNTDDASYILIKTNV